MQTQVRQSRPRAVDRVHAEKSEMSNTSTPESARALIFILSSTSLLLPFNSFVALYGQLPGRIVHYLEELIVDERSDSACKGARHHDASTGNGRAEDQGEMRPCRSLAQSVLASS